METISDYSVSQNDPEVKRAVSLATEVLPSLSSTVARLEYFSDWHRPKKAVALCRRYVQRLQSRPSKTRRDTEEEKNMKPLTVQELHDAEVLIFKLVQKETLPEISPVSSLSKLDPFVDMYGVTRVGGRLKKSNLPDIAKHPAILPTSSLGIITRKYSIRPEELR